MNPDERDLLAQVTADLERGAAELHRVQRHQAILREAATMLRIGRSASVVRALMSEQMDREWTKVFGGPA